MSSYIATDRQWSIMDLNETFYSRSGVGSLIPFTITNNAGASGPTSQLGEPGHPGVWRVRTGGGAALGNTIARGSVGLSGNMIGNNISRWDMSLRVFGSTSNNADPALLVLGLVIGSNTSLIPSQGIFFYHNGTIHNDSLLRVRVANTGGLNPVLDKVTSLTYNGTTNWRNFSIQIHGEQSVGQRFISFGFSDETSGFTNITQEIAIITEQELITGNVNVPFSINDVYVPAFHIGKQANGATERQIWYDRVRIRQAYA